MWNWMVSALATGAALVLYDGSPLAPSPTVLCDLVDRIGWVPAWDSPPPLARVGWRGEPCPSPAAPVLAALRRALGPSAAGSLSCGAGLGGSGLLRSRTEAGLEERLAHPVPETVNPAEEGPPPPQALLPVMSHFQKPPETCLSGGSSAGSALGQPDGPVFGNENLDASHALEPSRCPEPESVRGGRRGSRERF